MFTGIIEEMGTVLSVTKSSTEAHIIINANKIFEDLKLGDSVAVNGVCLTASEIKGNTFKADVMNETFSRSSLSQLKSGNHVNLERAMAANGRFGGHIVAGHVDGTGTISEIKKDGNAVIYKITASSKITKYIIEKGSIAIDGISLTVIGVDSDSFKVSIIPHTIKETVLSEKKEGSIVNLENDMIGKYVEQLLLNKPEENKQSGITADFLTRYGF